MCVNPEYILTPSFLGQSKKSLFGQLFGRGVLMRDITDKTEFGTNVSRAHQSTCSRSQRSRAGFRAARRCTVAAEFPWDIERLLRRCTKPEPLPMGGKILRNALTESEQRWLYALLLVMAVPDSGEVIGLRLTANPADMLRHNPDNRPQPLVTWVHPYTRESNARERPTALLAWAEQLMHKLAPESRAHVVVDSMLAQMYAMGGSLLKHRDEDLSWGLGVSLGCEAEFDCLPDEGEAQRIIIRSGDILIGEFGLLPHAVRVPVSAPPSWWRSVDHFGNKMRCNVLFRQALTAEQQVALTEQRARAVYGMSLAELRERTGHDNAYLAVHLRHAAVE